MALELEGRRGEASIMALTSDTVSLFDLEEDVADGLLDLGPNVLIAPSTENEGTSGLSFPSGTSSGFTTTVS
jgi:hypothetical protein